MFGQTYVKLKIVCYINIKHNDSDLLDRPITTLNYNNTRLETLPNCLYIVKFHLLLLSFVFSYIIKNYESRRRTQYATELARFCFNLVHINGKKSIKPKNLDG